MAATAEKVTPIEEGKDLVQIGKALVKFDIQEKVLLDLEEATKLEITDAASEKVVRKHRQNAKSIEVKIEKRRLELNREFKEKTDKAAGLISPRVTAAYTALDEKVKAVEEERDRKKAEAERIENERLASIQARFDILNLLAGKYQDSNRPSEKLTMDLSHLEGFEISSVDFQERTEEAEQIKSNAIDATRTALENREKFEAEQAEVDRVKAEQEAEAKRLEEERAKLEADRKAQEEANRKAAEAEAETRRLEEEAIRAEREALEAEKAKAAHTAIVMEREAVWEVAHQENLDRDHSAALIEHERFLKNYWDGVGLMIKDAQDRYDRTEKAKAAAAEREKLISPDRMMITTICTDLDRIISEYELPTLNTTEANTLVRDMVTTLNETIHYNERRAAELA